jgi:hypothetical protein
MLYRIIFRLFVGAAICIGLTSIVSAQQYAENLAFVTEVIREWAATERLRDVANKELEGGVNEKMSGCIRNGTRFKLELSTQIGMLQTTKLKPPFAELPGNLAEFYKRKIELFDKMSAGCEAMLTGPKPGVDYDALTVQAPKLTAEMDFIDHSIFEASPLIFSTLIDPAPDANGKMSKLVITDAQRLKLISNINSSFGKKLDQETQPWLVSGAWVLRGYLQKGYTPRPGQ